MSQCDAAALPSLTIRHTTCRDLEIHLHLISHICILDHIFTYILNSILVVVYCTCNSISICHTICKDQRCTDILRLSFQIVGICLMMMLVPALCWCYVFCYVNFWMFMLMPLSPTSYKWQGLELRHFVTSTRLFFSPVFFAKIFHFFVKRNSCVTFKQLGQNAYRWCKVQMQTSKVEKILFFFRKKSS